MKITELKNWNSLNPEEKVRLREILQVGANDNLPPSYVEPEDSPTQPPTSGETFIIHTDNVTVNQNTDKKPDLG